MKCICVQCFKRFEARDIAPLFRAVPSNVSLPMSFWEVIDPEPDRAGPWAAWSDWHRRKTERGQM